MSTLSKTLTTPLFTDMLTFAGRTLLVSVLHLLPEAIDRRLILGQLYRPGQRVGIRSRALNIREGLLTSRMVTSIGREDVLHLRLTSRALAPRQRFLICHLVPLL